MATAQHRPELIIWGSGSGTTFQAVAEAARDGLIDVDIPLVITDKPNAGILSRVAKINSCSDAPIETMIINRDLYPKGPQPRGQTTQEAEVTCEVLRRHPNAVLLLAGCMRILHEDVLREFGWQPEWSKEPDQGIYKPEMRIINTHPGPAKETADLYGVGPSDRVIELGLPQTAHMLLAVGGPIDGGPVIAEHRIDVPNYDLTTISRETAALHLFHDVVQPMEKAYLPFDVADFLVRRQVAA